MDKPVAPGRLMRVWMGISGAVGLLVTLSVAPLAVVLLVMAVTTVTSGPLTEENFFVALWSFVLSVSIFTYLNMLLFMFRLKRCDPHTYYEATEGFPAIAYMWGDKSAFRRLHGLITRRIIAGNAPVADKLRLHATFTRYLDIFCLSGWLALLAVPLYMFYQHAF